MKGRQKTLVIGGHGGIGSAIVRCLHDAGWDVTAPTHEELDVTDSSAIRDFFAHPNRHFNCLVYAAGVNDPKPFPACSEDDIAATFVTNTLAFLSVVKACLPLMKKRHSGTIVAINSLYGIISRKGRLPYAVSKHALTGAIQTLALELAADGILVNAVSPGFVKTRMTVKNNTPERIAELEREIPLKRMATGAEIAIAVKFLCSIDNTYITGQNLIVDGGYMAGGWQDE